MRMSIHRINRCRSIVWGLLASGAWGALLAAGGCAATDDGAAGTTTSLGAKLKARRAEFNAEAPPERRELYERGVEEVRTSGVLQRARNVGDRAPVFRLPDATGESVALAPLIAQGPVVLVWYRGSWCPYCNIQLQAWQEELDALADAGGTLVAISPETPDHALSSREKYELEFIVLTDAQNRVAREFGIVYTLPEPIQRRFNEGFGLNRWNDDESGELPLAATYVIGRDGVIRYAHLDADYRRRAEPRDVIAVVRSLR